MSKDDDRQANLDQLQNISETLPDQALKMLSEFAQFLAHKNPPHAVVTQKYQSIPRPDEENIIEAIKRLSKTYPMLDKKVLFQFTSEAMSAHVMQNIPTSDSIDQLEKMFREQYEVSLAKAR